ncbi:serine protease [Labrys sp. LIt4]|uniref:S1C family serine protease n=1 Tax=Labrys sp. LIt4 TaxID=2821355 RepID=UPI001AE0BFD7|nr:S1C family serine protease [Labrys sp. LIt4]MBP0582334.1 serine protease [Labrys sp. LIt4]
MRRTRTIGACVLAIAAVWAGHAAAQTKPPSAAPPAPAAPVPDPTFEAAKAAAAAMGAEDFASIQQDLIWTGDLNSLPSGEMGKRSYEAIRAFQKRIKAKETGIFTPPQRITLAQHAAKFTSRYGFETITERGITLGYPAKLTTVRTDGKNGPHFATPKNDVTLDILAIPADKENFEALFTRLKTERPGRKVTYSLLRPDFLVVAGANDGKSFYLRFVKTDADSRGFALGWDPVLSPGFDRVAIAMASSMKLADGDQPAHVPPAAKPAEPPAPPAEPPKPVGPPIPLPPGASTAAKVGIGVVVSANGDILTYAGLVAGCETVTLQGGATAKVVGGDLGNDIALVRASPAPGLAALAWRQPALTEGEAVSLLTGAAPTPTTVTALTGSHDDSRRVSLASGAPGALIDKDGALAGLAAANGEPTALKGLFVTAFLRAAGVTPPERGGDPTKATASLTCTPGKP